MSLRVEYIIPPPLKSKVVVISDTLKAYFKSIISNNPLLFLFIFIIIRDLSQILSS